MPTGIKMKRAFLILLASVTVLSSAAMADDAYVTRDQISQAQQALRQEGFYVATDGTMNPRTVAALRAYQATNQLPVTGTLDSDTMASLYVDDPTNAARDQQAVRINQRGY